MSVKTLVVLNILCFVFFYTEHLQSRFGAERSWTIGGAQGSLLQVYLDKSAWSVVKNSSNFLKSELDETAFLKKKSCTVKTGALASSVYFLCFSPYDLMGLGTIASLNCSALGGGLPSCQHVNSGSIRDRQTHMCISVGGVEPWNCLHCAVRSALADVRVSLFRITFCVTWDSRRTIFDLSKPGFRLVAGKCTRNGSSPRQFFWLIGKSDSSMSD